MAYLLSKHAVKERQAFTENAQLGYVLIHDDDVVLPQRQNSHVMSLIPFQPSS